jgi:hypothetical protein
LVGLEQQALPVRRADAVVDLEQLAVPALVAVLGLGQVAQLRVQCAAPQGVAVPATASAVTVSKAQPIGGQLRVEGSGAAPGGSVVIARSSTSAASARIDTKGAFRIQATGFRSDDCMVIVSDSTTPIAQATLAGCTPAPVTPPSPDPPPHTFSARVTDSAGATDVETFTITVVAPRVLGITTPATLPPATRGQAYQVNLSAGGGLPGYAWALKSGTLPAGLRL